MTFPNWECLDRDQSRLIEAAKATRDRLGKPDPETGLLSPSQQTYFVTAAYMGCSYEVARALDWLPEHIQITRRAVPRFAERLREAADCLAEQAAEKMWSLALGTRLKDRDRIPLLKQLTRDCKPSAWVEREAELKKRMKEDATQRPPGESGPQANKPAQPVAPTDEPVAPKTTETRAGSNVAGDESPASRTATGSAPSSRRPARPTGTLGHPTKPIGRDVTAPHATAAKKTGSRSATSIGATTTQPLPSRQPSGSSDRPVLLAETDRADEPAVEPRPGNAPRTGQGHLEQQE